MAAAAVPKADSSAHQKLRSLLLLTLVFAGCDRPTEPDWPVYLEIREMTVGPTLAKCYGVGLQYGDLVVAP